MVCRCASNEVDVSSLLLAVEALLLLTDVY